MQKLANALCWSRIAAAPVIAEQAARGMSARSWLFAGAIAAIAATDKLDGTLGRQAAKLRGDTTGEHGAWLDQLSDKVLVHGALGGIAVGAAMHGNEAFGIICAANQTVMIARDIWVTHERSEASGRGRETKAQTLGKLKTVMQMGFISIAASPVANLNPSNVMNGGEAVLAGALTATSGLAIASGVALVRSLRRHEPILAEAQPSSQAA
jgi:phosphatidylglycerophosphate synthase